MKIRHPLIFAVVLGGCDPAPAVAPTPSVELPMPAGAASAAARFFPLRTGYIYQYATETDAGEDMMITRVTRADAESGDLQGPQGTKTFRYVPDGVVLATGGAVSAYVLKAPLVVGNKWRGSGGSWVEIVAVDASVSVPAGAYTGCLKTLEVRGGDLPLRVATTYCPDTGIVELEAASGTMMERAVLKSYGPPVDLGPDGVRAIPPEEPPPAAPMPQPGQ